MAEKGAFWRVQLWLWVGGRGGRGDDGKKASARARGDPATPPGPILLWSVCGGASGPSFMPSSPRASLRDDP